MENEPKKREAAASPARDRKPEKLQGIRHFLAAAGYSAKGLKAAFRHEAAFRQDLLLVVCQALLLFLLPLSLECRLVMLALGGILLAVELLNSALEAVADLASPQWHELAGRAKDMGSAALFCLLATLGGGWAMILYKLFIIK